MWSVGLGTALLVFSHVYCSNLPPSPCPDVYGYETNEDGELRGLIAILAPVRYSEVQVAVVLSSPVPVREYEVGELALKGGKKGAEEATRNVLMGRRHVLQFYITFPPGKPIPTLMSIAVNEQEFCGNNQAPPDSRARITLHSFLSTGVSAPPTKEFGSVTGFFSSTPEQPGQEPLVSVVMIPPEVSAVKDDFHLSKMIVKLLNTLVEIQRQRLSVEQQLLSLGKVKHLSDKIYFSE